MLICILISCQFREHYPICVNDIFFSNHPHDVDDSLNSCRSKYRCKMGEFAKQNRFYYATCTTLAILIFQGICVLVMKSRKLKIRYLNLNFSMTCRNDRTFARVYLLCFAQEEIFNRNALMFQQNKYLWSLVLDFLSDFLSFLYCRKYIFS